jgi:hypothetical protein
MFSLGVVLFPDNIIVTAVWKSLADQSREPRTIAYAQRLVTVTDWIFTLSGVVLILVGRVVSPAKLLRLIDFILPAATALGLSLELAVPQPATDKVTASVSRFIMGSPITPCSASAPSSMKINLPTWLSTGASRRATSPLNPNQRSSKEGMIALLALTMIMKRTAASPSFPSRGAGRP